MSLWDWVSEFPLPTAAIPAMPATEQRKRGELSQLSQGLGDSQPDIDAASEAFEERAAIMEFDGGLSREQAERLASRSDPRAEPTAGRWRGEGLDLNDLRPCLLCRNLARSGRCMAAMRGELRAARDYSPTMPEQPRRCIGFRPPADDPDPRPGRERWPELVERQARL